MRSAPVDRLPPRRSVEARTVSREGAMANFLLIHGAGTGGWLWDAEAAVLRDRGHTVLAPTLTGVGGRAAEGARDTNLSTHVDEVVELIDADPSRPWVLVGFSYGGLVAGGAADRAPDRMAALIYLDAFVPVPGRSMFDLMPAQLRQMLESGARTSGDGWQMPPVPLEQLGSLGAAGRGVDLERVRKLLARRAGHPIGTYREPAPAPNPLARGVPRAYIACTDHPAQDPMTAVAAAVRQAGVPVHSLATGHFPMLTMPVELADLLETLAP
jgi:pimeloyl-ACP methyl ester carboxylesterase